MSRTDPTRVGRADFHRGNSMPVIDLAFELRGAEIPLDYGYALFAALSRVVPRLHGDRRVGVHPIRGCGCSLAG